MSAFVKLKTYHNGFVVDAAVNVDRILMVWNADYRDDMEGQCFYSMTDGFGTEHAAEPYDTVVAKILAATAKEKENIPPTPPIREKESPTEVIEREPTPARTREGSDLTCGGFLVPTLDEVKSVAASLGIPAETAEDFWNTNSATGWTYKGSRIIVWHPLLKAWHRAKKRAEAREKAQLERIDAKMDEREARRLAHMDAKMDERERKRERRSGGGRKKADNYIEMTDEVREEVRRDFTF